MVPAPITLLSKFVAAALERAAVGFNCGTDQDVAGARTEVQAVAVGNQYKIERIRGRGVAVGNGAVDNDVAMSAESQRTRTNTVVIDGVQNGQISRVHGIKRSQIRCLDDNIRTGKRVEQRSGSCRRTDSQDRRTRSGRSKRVEDAAHTGQVGYCGVGNGDALRIEQQGARITLRGQQIDTSLIVERQPSGDLGESTVAVLRAPARTRSRRRIA